MIGGLGPGYRTFRKRALEIIDVIEQEEAMSTPEGLLRRQKQLGEELVCLGHAIAKEVDHPRVLLHDLASLNVKLEDILTQRLSEPAPEEDPS